ncbi:hypothetical protein P4O66_004574 [Electrophorus voltai]|uniref:Alkylated DNA repair protein AlkB homologue 8 N-terminal domain-containing protein n=1 Tax=Electrophorus voltai TaxID=2609070 RepID=A0AAD9E426_9TELE|nr:hypothetical protein P4O66_004574 [Electrophorus voltai]
MPWKAGARAISQVTSSNGAGDQRRGMPAEAERDRQREGQRERKSHTPESGVREGKNKTRSVIHRQVGAAVSWVCTPRAQACLGVNRCSRAPSSLLRRELSARPPVEARCSPEEAAVCGGARCGGRPDPVPFFPTLRLLAVRSNYECFSASLGTTSRIVVGLISDNDERAYLEEIKHLENWCQENNLLLNVSKTKELIVDCSKKQERHYQPVRISGTTVERVDSFRYLGVHISQDLSWSHHTSSLAKKARQRLYHLRRLRDFRLPSKVLRNFYTCTIESILTGNITVWFGNSTKQDRQALQRVVRSAERITHSELPDLQTTYYKQCQTKARKIVKDPTHPNNRLFSLLRSGRRFRSLKAKTQRLKRSFFPQAIRALNQGN